MFPKLTTAIAATAVAATVLWIWKTSPEDNGNGRWKLVLSQPSLTYGEVIATGKNDAWAFGWDVLGLGAWIPMVDGPHRPTAFHWDGDSWQKSDLPIERGDIGSVVASSPSDVWALVGVEDGNSVLHWDGDTWTIAKKLPAVPGILTAADGNVWFFGDHKAWHYDGAAWSEQSLPFNAFRASARSASDIWALDHDDRHAHHFDGKAWTRIDLTSALPKTPPPSDDAPPHPDGPRFNAITADPSGVWITGEIGMSSFLLSQTDTGWRSEDTSAKAGRMIHGGPPVPDGNGGHWFLGSTDINGDESALAHRSPSGHWTKSPADGELTSLTAAPGGPLLATGFIGRAGVFRNLP